jgi:hypothetical protein
MINLQILNSHHKSIRERKPVQISEKFGYIISFVCEYKEHKSYREGSQIPFCNSKLH